MSDTTFEAAKRCPKCQEPGHQRHVERLRDGGKVFGLECKNQVCPWYDTGWVVQVDKDGEIPDRMDKPRAPTVHANISDEELERFRESVRRTPREGEVRNPFSR